MFQTLTLKDAMREAMRKEKFSPADVASLCDCSEQTVKNFLEGKTSEPHEEIRGKFQDFCSAYGVTRTAIMKKMHGKKQEQPVAYVNFAVEFLRHLIKEGKVTPSEFAKATGITPSTKHNLFTNKHKRVNTGARLMLKFFEDRWGIDAADMSRRMLTRDMTIGEPKMQPVSEEEDDNGNLVIRSAMKNGHYVCANLNDWESAVLISSIMGNPATPETEKKKLLGKLFAQEFPTLT